ncbi:MAG: insulinase family protein [Myxococcales bacterium]|nr:MAG: insulinase family protein [Myxococcales bacterium]
MAEIVDNRDNDRSLAIQGFRSSLFGAHTYGRSVLGHEKSISGVQLKDIKQLVKKHVVASNMVLGVSGDITRSELMSLLDKEFANLKKGSAALKAVRAPKLKKGRSLLVIDKPERTQSQIVIGTLGSHNRDRDHTALYVANTAFGGTFTARLMNEIRSKRGWSYGASSRLGHDREREAWWMWTFPAMDDAVACIKVQWELYQDFVRRGISKKELDFAKEYLINSHAFDIDTAAKRVDQLVDAEVMGLPPRYYENYVKRVKAVTLKEANTALKRRLSDNDVSFVIVATANKIEKQLRELKLFDSIKLLSFDEL